MPIQINAPEVEQRLQKEADRRGVTAADYALQILLRYLPELEDAESQEAVADEAPSATAILAERKRRFHAWVESHNHFPKLPPEAFERASFYEEQPA